jgi:hypothetical protein
MHGAVFMGRVCEGMALRYCLTLVWLIFQQSYAAQYYFSASLGNDAWSGTIPLPNAASTDGPKRSLVSLQTLLNDVAAPGDTLSLRAGDTWTSASSLVLSAVQGTAAQPVTLGRYGAGAPPMLQQNGAASMLVIRGSATPSRFVVIENLALESVTVPGDRGGGIAILEAFFPDKPSDIVLRNVSVRNFPQGINIQTDRVSLLSCELRGNKLVAPEPVGNASTGLFAAGSDITVRDSIFEDNGGNASFFVWNAYFSNGARIRFERNQIRVGNGGLKLRGITEAFISDNRIDNIAITPIAFGADAGAPGFANVSNVVIERNQITGSAEGIVLREQSGIAGSSSLSNISIQNNVISADVALASAAALILLDGNQTLTSVDIVHNTLWASQKSALNIAHPGPNGVRVLNNVLHASTGSHIRSNGALGSVVNALNNNLYAGSSAVALSGAVTLSTLTQMRTAFPSLEATGLSGNAQLSAPPSDLRPTAASAFVIDRALPSGLNNDFLMRVRPFDGDGVGGAQSDLGAYEFGAPTVGEFASGFE